METIRCPEKTCMKLFDWMPFTPPTVIFQYNIFYPHIQIDSMDAQGIASSSPLLSTRYYMEHCL